MTYAQFLFGVDSGGGGGAWNFNVLTLIQGDISYEFRGQSYDIFITENSKFWETSISLLKVNLGDIYISEIKFRGHLKKRRAKSPLFWGQEKTCVDLISPPHPGCYRVELSEQVHKTGEPMSNFCFVAGFFFQAYFEVEPIFLQAHYKHIQTNFSPPPPPHTR